MLDKLSPEIRHLILITFTALVTWAGTDFVPLVKDTPHYGPIMAVLLTTLITYLTPITRQYGVGSSDASDGE